MREIKFRAWYKGSAIEVDGKRVGIPAAMEPPGSWLLLSQVGRLYSHGPMRGLEKEDDSLYEIMQYTGLKDSNGKEIYEGDVLQIGEDGSIREIVEWKENMWTEEGFMTGYGEWFGTADQYKVIGNIYENPELLKDSE